jgi:hypothetical protein
VADIVLVTLPVAYELDMVDAELLPFIPTKPPTLVLGAPLPPVPYCAKTDPVAKEPEIEFVAVLVLIPTNPPSKR